MEDAQVDERLYELALRSQAGIDMDGVQEKLQNVKLENIVNAINRLLSSGKLELLQKGNKVLYKGVSAQELETLGGLDIEERLIYKLIENSGNEGIWIRTLKLKSNLPQTVVTRHIKTLEQKNLIKSVKSIKFPTRKVYMLVQFTPSADITGGPWYTDQEMDTDFIDQLANQCYQFIHAYSFPQHKPDSVFSANHTKYPTASQVRSFIIDNRISNVDLATEHIEQLLTMLVYDGKIEKVSPSFDLGMGPGPGGSQGEWMYRAIRISAKDSPLTDIPCGRCPIANRCNDSGDITPATCEYLAKWLTY
ncbi:34-kDa subunit of RNA polymerase III (C) [Coemansia sp. RSA 2336]|nr:34-kDa subunit of RNA polymerase III (C) [Coemansia sp. RSA 2336]